MDEIARALGAYRACIDFPDDVTEDELRQEAAAMLGHAREGVSLMSLTQDIAIGLANRLRMTTINNDDCARLASALLELVSDPRP
jgi:hypothetical protein